ncbi:Cytochrome P450 [Pseudomonas syringae pv. actinidiae]|uniref:Cytochrome P450 n=1 Tax=Pseudomonas syringae pv. actinidiae TaxID=103796 RepID=A0A2V0QFV0_PSESF|nr:Cytochrome P450 [Pseudomonas syringae pv. actinidiae]GBH16212.1 Cytochrome P450 [Pseudomonas syringae pv. actinidiae]
MGTGVFCGQRDVTLGLAGNQCLPLSRQHKTQVLADHWIYALARLAAYIEIEVTTVRIAAIGHLGWCPGGDRTGFTVDNTELLDLVVFQTNSRYAYPCWISRQTLQNQFSLAIGFVGRCQWQVA